jgi:hypothetical protein
MSDVKHILNQCGICLESHPESEDVNMCSDKSHDGMCKGCAVSYISNKIDSAFLGSCPTMLCPCLHADGKRRRTLDYKQWRTLVPEKDVKEHSSLADSILAFLCGGCHSLKSLQITSTEEQILQAHGLVKKSIEAVSTSAGFEAFTDELNQFTSGELSVEEFYARICTVHFSGIMVSSTHFNFPAAYASRICFFHA